MFFSTRPKRKAKSSTITLVPKVARHSRDKSVVGNMASHRMSVRLTCHFANPIIPPSTCQKKKSKIVRPDQNTPYSELKSFPTCILKTDSAGTMYVLVYSPYSVLRRKRWLVSQEDRPLISNASAVKLVGKAKEEERETPSCTFGFFLPFRPAIRHSGLQQGNWFARCVVPFRMMQGTYKQPSYISTLFLFPPCIISYHGPLCSAMTAFGGTLVCIPFCGISAPFINPDPSRYSTAPSPPYTILPW